MLHRDQKVLFQICLGAVILVSLLACKRDTQVHSENETAYLADYEAPLHKWGFMDTMGQLAISPLFDDVMAFAEGLACVNKEGRWGYINRDGQEIIPFTYRAGWAFHEGFARVKPFDGPVHFITRQGKQLISDEWEAADEFSEGMAKVSLGNTFGFIDTSGQLRIAGPFTKAGPFRHGVAIVVPEEKAGAIDRNGHFLLPPEFNSIRWSTTDELLICQKSDSAFLFDAGGKLLFQMNSIRIREATSRVAAIEKDKQFFLVDLQSKKVNTDDAWKNLFYLNDHRWAGNNAHGYYMITESGDRLNLKPYDQINKIQQGYAACLDGEYWGYLDTIGKETTSEIFGLAWDYKEGFARVAFKDGIAFINRHQQLAFYPPPGTMDMRDFSEGLAPVQIMKE